MFPKRYFPPRYFYDRYWPPVAHTGEPVIVDLRDSPYIAFLHLNNPVSDVNLLGSVYYNIRRAGLIPEYVVDPLIPVSGVRYYVPVVRITDETN